MTTPYRLIWFQHFHKAAGTSIINLAKVNQENFWPHHNNGNPTDGSGNDLRLWEYSTNELDNFIDSCEQKNVTFVATEWGLPEIEHLSSDNRVLLVTCIRNPLDRYVSNFYYDLYNGYTDARTLYDYQASRERVITTFNYYSRILLSVKDCSAQISPEEFEVALSILGKFNICTLLDNGLDQLCKLLSWRYEYTYSNQVSTNLTVIIKLLIRGKLKLAYLRLKYPKVTPSEDFIKHFKSENVWDIKLYNQILNAKK